MKVLFIAEVASIHSARWIQATTELGIDAGIFHPVFFPTAIHPSLSFFKGPVFCPTNLKGPASIAQYPFSDSSEFYSKMSKNDLYPKEYAAYLLRVIRKFRPDFIHVLGICVNMNNQIRCLNLARKKAIMPLPPVVYSSWGADLDYFFPNYPEEQKPIRSFLKKTSFYISECQRDLGLAQKNGFRGKFKGFLPANGGFDTEVATRPKADQKRPILMIKGRDQADGDLIGRAMVILESLALCSEVVKPFQIQIIQAHNGENIRHKAAELSAQYGLNIEVLPYLSSEELFSRLSQSYLYISMTINDGLPLSLVEAMAMGAFPIFADLESIRDYIQSGKNGILTPWDQPQTIAEAITKAIQNPEFVEQARHLNYRLIDDKLSKKSVAPQIEKIYLEIRESCRIPW